MSELVTINQSTIPPAVISTGLEEFKLKPGPIDLVQRTSVEGTPGKFRDPLTGNEFSYLTIVPLRVRPGRVLFPPGFDRKSEPICKSDDGVTPSRFVEFPQNSSCKTCPQSQWVGGKKPPCSETASMLVIIKPTTDEEDPNYSISSLPKILNFRGTSMSSYKDFMTAIRQDQVRLQSQGEFVNLYDYTARVTPQEVRGGSGIFYIWKFTETRRVKETNQFGPFFQQYVTDYRQQEQFVEQEAKVDNAVGDVVNAEFVDV